MTLEQKVRGGFARKRVIVIGDAVADQFLEGTISRFSREAPVFILRHDETSTFPGGAGNAAANAAALGANVALIGFAGDDLNGKELRSSLTSRGIDTSGLIDLPGVRTVTKLRILAGHAYAVRQQVIRVDYEGAADVGTGDRTELIEKLRAAADSADAIILSDYGYGVVSPEVFEEAKQISNSRAIPLIVDSRHRLAEFAGATTATPNREEVEQILGENFTPDDCSRLREQLGLEALLVTNGNQGMTLFEPGKQPITIPAVGARQPVDVTGAGDTVIATYAIGLAAGLTFSEAADVANYAGGLVVMKKGTATISLDELLASVASNEDASLAQSK
jgi:rfaE bifunctional protein kinase chain/domain